MTPWLCKAARQMMGWTQEHLASLADVSRTTVSKYESGKTKRANKTTQNSICTAFDKAGVEFFGPPQDPHVGLRIFDAALFEQHWHAQDASTPAQQNDRAG